MRIAKTIAMQKVVGSRVPSAASEVRANQPRLRAAREHRRRSDTERTLGTNKSAAARRGSRLGDAVAGASRLNASAGIYVTRAAGLACRAFSSAMIS
jgi:hypothetical protein